ncbi:MAG: DMT family transporter [Pseudomonadaceae bacterium]|nr:DMT family transporter [Pseudomonadaceae bacterium]
MSTLSRELRGDLLILFAAFIWGVALYFQKTAMDHIGPMLFVALRSAIAAIALAPFAFIERARAKHKRSGLLGFALFGGTAFFLAAYLQQLGLVTATVTNTGFLTAIYVVLTPLIIWAMKRQRPENVVWIAVALSMAGTWGLSGGELSTLSTGDWLVIASAVFWSVHIVNMSEATARLASPLAYTCATFAVVSVISMLFALSLEPISWDAIRASALEIIFVGVVSSAFTFAIMAIALKDVPAPRAAILVSSETLFSAAAGYLLLGERLVLLGWLGAGLILAAVLVLQLKRVSPVAG